MVAVLGLDKEEIHQAVQDMYTVVATEPETPLHFPIGFSACKLAGYDQNQVQHISTSVLDSFAGVGCPFHANVIKKGDVVLDVGSGSGTDVFIAADMVGQEGKVWAMDFTPAMRTKLLQSITSADVSNIEVLAGDAENIPLPDSSVDVVTSNGVLNLVIDKRRAIGEIFRVLKPGGFAQIADIVIAAPVTPDCEDDPRLWAECVVGATVDETYINMFQDAGFLNVEIVRDYDYFAHSPSQETKEVARQFGAHAFELRMQRAEQAPAKIIQLFRRFDPRRGIKNLSRRGLWGSLSLFLSLLACYGTLGLTGLVSALGASLVIDEGVWAGTILIFALLAFYVVLLGFRKHRSWLPSGIAAIGIAMLAFTMTIQYSALIEFIGFVFLAGATLQDYSLRRWSKVKGGKKHGKKPRRSSHYLQSN